MSFSSAAHLIEATYAVLKVTQQSFGHQIGGLYLHFYSNGYVSYCFLSNADSFILINIFGHGQELFLNFFWTK